MHSQRPRFEAQPCISQAGIHLQSWRGGRRFKSSGLCSAVWQDRGQAGICVFPKGKAVQLGGSKESVLLQDYLTVTVTKKLPAPPACTVVTATSHKNSSRMYAWRPTMFSLRVIPPLLLVSLWPRMLLFLKIVCIYFVYMSALSACTLCAKKDIR